MFSKLSAGTGLDSAGWILSGVKLCCAAAPPMTPGEFYFRLHNVSSLAFSLAPFLLLNHRSGNAKSNNRFKSFHHKLREFHWLNC